MDIQVTKINKEHKEIFLNLYNLYLYDLSVYNGDELKEDGKFDPTNTYLYLERDELHPYLITRDEKIVGFILVCSSPFVPEGIDYSVQELFILRKYRGNNIATIAVKKILDKFKGKIRIEQLKSNESAVNFWKKYYNKHNISYIENEERIEVDGLEGMHTVIIQEFKIEK